MQTQSFWMKNTSILPFSMLDKNLQADICIIGAGISGLTSGYLLQKMGKSVVILERGEVARGETSRTTAHLTNVLDDRYYDLEKFFGEKGSRTAAESHQAAVDFIENLVKQERIDCGFEHVEAYLFAPPGEKDILEKEFQACKRAGLDVDFVQKAPFSSFDTGQCLRFKKQAQFYPLKYINALAKLFVNMGGQIFTHTPVTGIEETSTECTVKTRLGWNVKANQVVVATNSPINDRVFIHTKQAAYRTYVIGAKIPKGVIQKGLYYDTLDPYHYIRLADFDQNHDWALIGGEDHRTGQKKEILEIYSEIEKWARERFPELGKIEYQWSGQILEPVDSLAFIGKDTERCYIITGDSGNGLTHGTIGAIINADLITGKSNSWEHLYRPHRKTLTALPEFVSENFCTAEQYVDWLLPGEIKSETDLAKGAGAIIKKDGKPVAVYKDEAGNIHRVSGVCPHLYGVVQWNEGEKSWDCPCHGSRFNVDGCLLNTPAISDLSNL